MKRFTDVGPYSPKCLTDLPCPSHNPSHTPLHTDINPSLSPSLPLFPPDYLTFYYCFYHLIYLFPSLCSLPFLILSTITFFIRTPLPIPPLPFGPAIKGPVPWNGSQLFGRWGSPSILQHFSRQERFWDDEVCRWLMVTVKNSEGEKDEEGKKGVDVDGTWGKGKENKARKISRGTMWRFNAYVCGHVMLGPHQSLCEDHTLIYTDTYDTSHKEVTAAVLVHHRAVSTPSKAYQQHFNVQTSELLLTCPNISFSDWNSFIFLSTPVSLNCLNNGYKSSEGPCVVITAIKK